MDELHIKGFLCFYGEISRCSSALHTKQSDCWMDGRIEWETVVKHWLGKIRLSDQNVHLNSNTNKIIQKYSDILSHMPKPNLWINILVFS